MGEKAINLDPYNANAHRSYAHALTSVAEYDLAMEELQQAIDLNPNYLPPYFELALLLLANDRDQEAIDIYDRILSMQPRNARAMLRQCQAYRKVGEFQRALGFCQDSVSEDPTYLPAQFQLGMLHYRERQFAPAQEAFQACVDIGGANLDCFYRLGLTHYYLGDCQTGWDILQDALIMAGAREGTAETIEDIRQGLTAIGSDANCAGVGRIIPAPTSIPTAEATEESGGI